jgi:L-histidine N-alpha-methyltransferase
MSQPSSIGADSAIATREFIGDVRKGLVQDGQKFLPSQYLYDTVGSALFEVITLLPEYGLTRADDRLLETYARELPTYFPVTPSIVELGSGTGSKTRRVLQAFEGTGEIEYFPIDISVAALKRCETELMMIEGVRVRPLARSYIEGLREVVQDIPLDKPLLLLFLGSTIGNFDRPVGIEFLSNIRRILRPGDVLCLGTDLEKPVEQLLSAYDDPTGVTAAFNRNMLSRINRELGGTFDLSQFAHRARWDPDQRRVEMHLESLTRQEVEIEAGHMTVQFERGETIWTESSHKFNCPEITRMAQDSGFRCDAQWTDPDWPFAENVLIAD